MASDKLESRRAESNAADSHTESKSQKCENAECEIIKSKSLADSSAPCPQKIGFYRSAFIGDSVVAIHALYALCKLYPRAQIVVYTNTEGAQIFSQLAEKVGDFDADSADSASLAESVKSPESTNPAESKEVQNANFLDSDNSLDFADSNSYLDSASTAQALSREHLRDFSSRFVCVNTDEMSREELASHIKREAFECFLLTQPNRWRCALVASSGTKRIITFATARNALQPRFEKVLFSRAFSRITYREALLKLVRRIDARHYDSCISGIDFARITFCQDAKSNAKISHFIDNISKNFLRQATPTTTQVAPATQATQATPANIICINPFVRSSPTNLSLESYATLATRLAERYRHIIFVFISFAGAPSLPKLDKSLPNIAIFENDKNLANLIALLRASKALISPSTGTIHIADMLQVPTIGIYSPKDMRLWLGANMRKDFMLVLKKPLQKMHSDDERRALESAFTTAIYAINRLGDR